jgi:hypothetical protein
VTASWRPFAWLTAHATGGVDHGSQDAEQRLLPQANAYLTLGHSLSGQLEQTQGGTDIYSAEVRASAIASPWRWLRLPTSVGIQMADTRTAGLVASAQTTKTQQTLNGGANFLVTQLGDRSATLGGYVEEGFGLFDQFYWSLAMRYDAGSGFGSQVGGTTYPKLDLSYPVLKHGPTTLRLRTALGAAGRQPNNGANRLLYNDTQTAYVNGVNVATASIIGPGNPNLKPERSMEYEGGFDLGGWDGRLSAGLTASWKSTTDALIDQQLGFDLANWIYEENVGDIHNTNLEASVSAMVLQTRAISWSVTVSGAMSRNKLVRIDPGFTQAAVGFGGSQRQVRGYPLYGYWAYRYHYVDGNHDGIVEYNELKVDTSASYIGSSIPIQEGSLTTHIGLLRNTFTFGALFSYAGRYKVYNYSGVSADLSGSSLTVNNPRASLADQARALAGMGYSGTSAAIQDGTFLRFREVSLTYEVPARWVQALRVHSLGVTGAVRNLALWSRFAGADPEVSNPGLTVAANGSPSVNNDVRVSGDNAVPLARTWFVRVNLGW